ncbi:hypothetical protein [Paenibacillus sp. FSL K6-1230]
MEHQVQAVLHKYNSLIHPAPITTVIFTIATCALADGFTQMIIILHLIQQ